MEPTLQLSNYHLLADAEATTLQVNVNANTDFTIQIDKDANWLRLQTPSVADTYQSGNYELYITQAYRISTR